MGRRRQRGGRNRKNFLSPDVMAILTELEKFLDSLDANGRIPCNVRCGVYSFFDFDGEPSYVGQTREQIRVRIRRHLTNQRTDAVAMDVLDPMEVAEIEVWPFWDLESADNKTRAEVLASAEYSLFQKVIAESPIHRVLNEKVPAPAPLMELPASHRSSIIPESLRERLSHPDIRITRRASEIASLARIITERDVQLGLQNALVTQATRLQRLSESRFAEVRGEMPQEQIESETVNSNDGDDHPLGVQSL